MGEFLNQHCVAAYQQVGDFEVTKVNGQVQKNGGNVVSYFLTPEGRVIDALVGPVTADKFLSEAQWSEQLFQQTTQHRAVDSIALVRQAHLAQPADRVHQFLAENPLAPLPAVYEYVFETLANQKVGQERAGATAATAALEKANKSGRPVLLVLTRANADRRAHDAATERLLDRLGMSPAARPAKSCLVVWLPIDELPALSNLTDVPAYDLAERTTPTMVLLRPSGEQIAAIRAEADSRDLAAKLWSALNDVRFDKAQTLIEAGETKLAGTYLGLVKSSPIADPLKELARQQWEQLRAGKPVQPTTAAAAAKPAASASAGLDLPSHDPWSGRK
ncbi:MAG TPA: hypothetical protein VGX78_16475 [Pirellulales bacterium]|nr:hypothetical protein [Pirellulales bacterium]